MELGLEDCEVVPRGARRLDYGLLPVFGGTTANRDPGQALRPDGS
jgi:hypothetical protein